MNESAYTALSRSDQRVFDFMKSKCFGGVFTLSQAEVSAILKISLKTVNRTFEKLKSSQTIARSGKVWVIHPDHFFNRSEEQFNWKLQEFSELVARGRVATRKSADG